MKEKDKVKKMTEKLQTLYVEVQGWQPETAWDEANERSLRILKSNCRRLEAALERYEQRQKNHH